MVKTIPRQFRLTERQNAVFETRLQQTEETINMYIRRLIAQDAEANGLTFPQDTPDPSTNLEKARAKRWTK